MVEGQAQLFCTFLLSESVLALKPSDYSSCQPLQLPFPVSSISSGPFMALSLSQPRDRYMLRLATARGLPEDASSIMHATARTLCWPSFPWCKLLASQYQTLPLCTLLLAMPSLFLPLLLPQVFSLFLSVSILRMFSFPVYYPYR